MKTVLVTGAHGFLGRNVAAMFNRTGYEVHGIGIGTWLGETPDDFGIRRWCEAVVTVETLQAMNCCPDVVVHCAGSGSVGFSLANPYDDFNMTVGTTAAVLEYQRTSAPQTRLIYPSSAAVYGCMHSGPIIETAHLDPVSPYGVHKLAAEQLCLSASRNFGIDCRIARFFSLYGPGLRKQLLWDASRRLSKAGNRVEEFFGSGSETRDWLHVSDAATLMLELAENDSFPLIVNGGSGIGRPVDEVLEGLREGLGSRAEIRFNGQVRTGDPQHLQADVSRAVEAGWKAEVSLDEGLKEYAAWFRSLAK